MIASGRSNGAGTGAGTGEDLRASADPARDPWAPAYLALSRSGELRRRAEQAAERLSACDLCARDCGVDRRASIRGTACRTGARAIVHSFGPHYGEEDCLSGTHGSGTIFFSGCNLRCLACQNWEISWRGDGEAVTDGELAAMMLDLQRRGCHNINLVSPSHVVAQVIAAVGLAAENGLHLPIVYNTGGYDSLTTLALLDGIVDIYMPDMKFADDTVARAPARVPDYVAVNRAAVREMHRQVGDLEMDRRGIARRGLLVRHLVLPVGLAGTEAVLAFLAREVSTETYVNLMDQYRPCYRAAEIPALARPITAGEFAEARRMAEEAGIRRLDGHTPLGSTRR